MSHERAAVERIVGKCIVAVISMIEILKFARDNWMLIAKTACYDAVKNANVLEARIA